MRDELCVSRPIADLRVPVRSFPVFSVGRIGAICAFALSACPAIMADGALHVRVA